MLGANPELPATSGRRGAGADRRRQVGLAGGRSDSPETGRVTADVRFCATTEFALWRSMPGRTTVRAAAIPATDSPRRRGPLQPTSSSRRLAQAFAQLATGSPIRLGGTNLYPNSAQPRARVQMGSQHVRDGLLHLAIKVLSVKTADSSTTGSSRRGTPGIRNMGETAATSAATQRARAPQRPHRHMNRWRPPVSLNHPVTRASSRG